MRLLLILFMMLYLAGTSHSILRCQSVSFMRSDAKIKRETVQYSKGYNKALLYENNVSKRQKVFVVSGLSAYTVMASGLYFAWYDKYEQESFHFFNDWNEWRHMDKWGHSYSAYFQAELITDLAQWAGYDRDKALLMGSLSSIAGQLTIEVMDGFSSGWGFSVADVGANIIGTSTYYLQEKYWGEQRLRFKMSYYPIRYQSTPLLSQSGHQMTTLKSRADDLFGPRGVEKLLKDYNGQTIWLSANVRSFVGDGVWPAWLSVALGYSIDGVYGGYANAWEEGLASYKLDDGLYPRSSQFILALDYDLSKVKTDKVFLKGVLKFLNIFKWPAPGISYSVKDGEDKSGQWQVHVVFLN